VMRQAPSGVRGLPRRSADWARCSPVVIHMNRQSQHAYGKHTRFRGARRPRGTLRYEIAEGESRGPHLSGESKGSHLSDSFASRRDATPFRLIRLCPPRRAKAIAQPQCPSFGDGMSRRDSTPLTHASRDMWHARLAAAPLVRPILPPALSKGKSTIDNSLHVGKQILHKIEFILKKYE
jgi:hypothetical protein